MENPRYEIKSLIGKGRTGGVYLAEDTTNGKIVAMRRFFFQYPGDDSAWEQSFTAIDPVSLNFKFPNTLPVINSGIDEDGPFIITPYIENAISLSKFIKQNAPVSIGNFHTIASQLLTALSAIHESGRTHGNIYPNSVLITKQGNDKPSATLIDWSIHGIANHLATQHGDENPLRELPMTAPEILRGGKSSPHADTYALGQLLYTLWFGGHPYAGETPDQILERFKNGERINISKNSNPLPAGFSTWLRNLMHPDVKLRTQSGTVALNTFPPILISKTSPAPKPAPTPAASKTPASATATSKKGGKTILISLAAITITGVIAALTQNSKPTKEPPATTKNPPEKISTQTNPKPKAATPQQPKITKKHTPTAITTKPEPKPELPVLIITPVKPTPPHPTPPSTSTVNKGNYRFQPIEIFTTDFKKEKKTTATIDLNHDKQYAWAFVNRPELNQILRGGANTNLTKMIAISKIGEFSFTPILTPQAHYNIAEQPPIPEAVFAQAEKNKINPGQGFRITIKIPSLGTDPIHIGMDTRSALADLSYSITATGQASPVTHITNPPPESIDISATTTLHSRQTITIVKPIPNSTVTIDLTIHNTHLKKTNQENFYSLGLNAITIWRD